MLFNSLVFLFIFLPVTLLLIYIAPGKLKNLILFILSLLFYAWGGVSYSILLLVSIVANFAFGIGIDAENRAAGKRYLIAGVIFNLALLSFFKYANFIVQNINDLLAGAGNVELKWDHVKLPVGISFFTFQAISYLVDVYRKQTRAQKSFVKLGLFISMFPQLVAGPIVRYKSIEQQLDKRSIDYLRLAHGIERFIVGLAKKVLLADTFASAVDQVFDVPADNTIYTAWLGIILYALQIYYDFSGYSDMAIGLGKMIGFDLPENFNFPYIARSVKEFWRRWHITLSDWFRDYLYIPLGGNRETEFHTYRNLLIVFFLTGLWHGASWNFVLWGLFHGFFLVLERLGLGKLLERIPSFFRHFYTLLVVVLAWVLFRAPDFDAAMEYYDKLFDFAMLNNDFTTAFVLLDRRMVFCLLIGLLGASPLLLRIWEAVCRRRKAPVPDALNKYAVPVFYVALFVLSILEIMTMTHHPFIYFQF